MRSRRSRRSLKVSHTQTSVPCETLNKLDGGQGGGVVTLSSPTSEIGVRFPTLLQVGKLVVACRWAAVYSTEP